MCTSEIPPLQDDGTDVFLGRSDEENTRECEMKATMTVAEEQGTVHGETKVGLNSDTNTVPLSSLSEMTGFPVDFIKSELLVNDDRISMDELRQSMASYLESTLEEIK